MGLMHCFHPCLHNCSIQECIARAEADINWPGHPVCLVVQHFRCGGSWCVVICNTKILTLHDLSHRSIYISHVQSFLSPLLLCSLKTSQIISHVPRTHIYSDFKSLFLLYDINDQMQCFQGHEESCHEETARLQFVSIYLAGPSESS